MSILSKDKPDYLTQLILAGMKSERQINRNGRLYAGSSGFCERQTALDSTYSGLEVTEPKSTGYFALGIAIEELILNSILKMNGLLIKQLETPNIGINIGGKVDGIVYIEKENKIVNIEIKSCGTKLPLEPNPTHKAQALIYSGIDGLDSRITYYSRNVADFKGDVLLKTFDLGYDETEIYNAMYKACFGYLASKDRVMPKIPLNITQDQCGFCRFIPVCWQGGIAHLVDITSEQSKIISDKAKELTSHILEPSNQAARRDGILRKIKLEGTTFGKNLLQSKNWQEII